jgi:hypothetical protein
LNGKRGVLKNSDNLFPGKKMKNWDGYVFTGDTEGTNKNHGKILWG